ncbi:hypothetical protein SAMN05216268_12660 [Streptomyces yunnanensis]|uniref:Uncharacterized protein n=1 Tax=Streptomyces yunnanensis TaxID=156453 RepID=A0A9X8N7S9_9ACTN|nr:hypothetical protein SAMN05216268_12660 [Streptomyces yunnanensis]
MTIRVSRDNGETFARKTTYEIDRDKPPVPLVSFVWPPCECPLHRTTETEERRTA